MLLQIYWLEPSLAAPSIHRDPDLAHIATLDHKTKVNPSDIRRGRRWTRWRLYGGVGEIDLDVVTSLPVPASGVMGNTGPINACSVELRIIPWDHIVRNIQPPVASKRIAVSSITRSWVKGNPVAPDAQALHIETIAVSNMPVLMKRNVVACHLFTSE